MQVKTIKTWMRTHAILLSLLSPLSVITQNSVAASELKPILKPTRPTPTKKYEVAGEMAFRFAIKHGFKFYPEFISINNNTTPRRDYDGSAITGVKCAASIRGANCQGLSEMIRGSHAVILHPCKIYLRQGNGRWEPVFCSNLFHFFKGKKLNPGWTLENITMGPNQDASWVTSRDKTNPHIKLILTRKTDPNSKADASIYSLTLRGPINGRWQDAFDSRYKLFLDRSKK